MISKLTPLQLDFLNTFFKHEDRFFLTGGGALAGFHLGHRETHDLDLFTLEDAMADGVTAAADVTRELGGTLEPIQTAPEFRRMLIRRGEEAVVVDLVRERVVQRVPQKIIIDGIRIDPPEEIVANKLCALLSRSEIRDLVDLRALELAGYSVESALDAAAAKDSGLTAAQLAWVLGQIELDAGTPLPGGVSTGELRKYVGDLIARLERKAFPGN